jgi:2-polyprenyl-3-methyl-5-hydroxy-6-metoxy-1,4-benzoquinol methylase
MARIFTPSGVEAPKIDEDAVVDFFEVRAKKAAVLGPLKAVLYQDKDADLASRRDVAEKLTISPLLGLSSASRVLDAGCGTGRWTKLVRDTGAYYHGADVSQGLINIALQAYSSDKLAKFTVCPVEALSLEKLGEHEGFTHIFCFGIFIYLNDTSMRNALTQLAEMASKNALIVIREPISMESRLTLREHFSEDMEQFYHAIYRTEQNLIEEKAEILGSRGFVLQDAGDVYSSPELNNRRETRQRYFIWKRV